MKRMAAEAPRALSQPELTRNYWISAALVALMTALLLEGAFHLRLLLAWLIAINVFAFLYYAIDKLNSIFEDECPEKKSENWRIPEHALLILALIGGSLGGLLAVLVCNHFTDHGWFVFRLLAILVAHGVILYFLWGNLQLM
jgi:uncharacterized membrane protein YsdA (DUF1294 family)